MVALNFSIKCSTLVDADYFSKNDSFASLEVKKNGCYVRVGKTEVINNNNNPEFYPLKVDIPFKFGQRQMCRVVVYDQDSLNSNDFIGRVEFALSEMCHVVVYDQDSLNSNDFIGRVEFALSEVLKTGNTLDKPLLRAGDKEQLGSSRIQIYTTRYIEVKDTVTFQFQAKNLQNKDSILGLFGHSDPYFVISKGDTEVCKSNVVKNNENPTWKPIAVTVEELCCGDLDLSLTIEVYDDDRFNKNDKIGELTTTLRDLLKLKPEDGLAVVNLKKKAKKSDYKNSGFLHLISIKRMGFEKEPCSKEEKPSPKEEKPSPKEEKPSPKVEKPSPKVEKPTPKEEKSKEEKSTSETKKEVREVMVKTVSKGTGYGHEGITGVLCMSDINLTVGIDWTRSPGDWRIEHSPHYLNRNSLNPYEKSIHDIGTALESYDTDKLFPVYGCGGMKRGMDKVSDHFHVNMNKNDPNCYRISGVLDAYRKCMKSGDVGLYGMANTAPLINNVTKVAADSYCKPQIIYNVVLIIMNDDPADFEETHRALIASSAHPVSVIFVGVGDASFTKLRDIDRQGPLKTTCGLPAKRDNVQFLLYRKYENGEGDLGRDALSELRDQVNEYYREHTI